MRKRWRPVFSSHSSSENGSDGTTLDPVIFLFERILLSSKRRVFFDIE
jgi:hypothetical protein